jgi:hypothetical protein
MKKIVKILLMVFIFNFIIISSVQAAPVKKYNKYEDDNISLSYPNDWSVKQNWLPLPSEEINYYFIKNTKSVSNDSIITIAISGPTTSTINNIKNKFPFAGDKMKKGKISAIKFSGLKAFKRVADYKDNLNRSQRILAYWTIDNREEIWVYYQGSTKWYNKYYKDAIKIIDSIKLKKKSPTPMVTLEPAPANSVDICDSNCKEKILTTCSQGEFFITRIRGPLITKINFKFSNQPGSSSGVCKTVVSILQQSAAQDLLGLTMECMLKPKIKSLFDLQNFVTDKFAPLDSNDFSSCEGWLYDKIKNLEL